MIALLLAAALCPHPHRSRSVVQQFIKEYRETHEGRACPISCATFVLDKRGKPKLYMECGACAADHVCPLGAGGVDAPDNFQWLTAKENRKKSDSDAACKEPFYMCGTRR